MKFFLFLCLLASFWVTSSSSSSPSPCSPPTGTRLPFSGGWYGGDGDVSVALSNATALWFFADTIVGPGPRPSATGMPHNSAGLMALLPPCASPPSPLPIAYSWGDNSSASSPSAFLPGPPGSPPSPAAPYYWVADALLWRGTVYAFAMTESPAGLFDLLGVTLVSLTPSPPLPPPQWPAAYLQLTDSPSAYYASAALTPDAAHCLVHALVGQAVFLLRLPAASLPSPSGAFEYLAGLDAGQPVWAPCGASNLPGKGAVPVQLGPEWLYATEFTVRPRAGLGWVAVISSAKDMAQAHVLVAKQPWGPFVPAAAYAYPELRDPAYPQGTFCYAAKEHTEMENGPLNVVFTYVCNLASADFPALLNASYLLYDPAFVQVQLDESFLISS